MKEPFFFSPKCKMQNVSSRKLVKTRKFLGFGSFSGFRMKKTTKSTTFLSGGQKERIYQIRRKRVLSTLFKGGAPSLLFCLLKAQSCLYFCLEECTFPDNFYLFFRPPLLITIGEEVGTPCLKNVSLNVSKNIYRFTKEHKLY